MGDLVNAIRDYQAAVKTDPSYALAYYNAANVYFRQRQFKQASKIFISSNFSCAFTLPPSVEPRQGLVFEFHLTAPFFGRSHRQPLMEKVTGTSDIILAG